MEKLGRNIKFFQFFPKCHEDLDFLISRRIQFQCRGAATEKALSLILGLFQQKFGLPPWTAIFFSGGGGGFQLTLFRWVWYFVCKYFRGGWW